jgi:hypothetical protein
MGPETRPIRRIAVAAFVGLVMALALPFAPAAVPALDGLPGMTVAPARAAQTDIDIGAATRYVVMPSKSVIRVTVDITAVNQRPTQTSGGVVTRYYYDGVNLGIQPEAVNLRATQDGASARVTSSPHGGYRLTTIYFRSNLYYGETARVRLTFDLPAGAPRSSSDVRAGPAFASFLAWAFGDHGSVRVEVPAGFAVTATGADLATRTRSDGTQVLTAEPASPGDWYAWIDARNDNGLVSEQLSLTDGERITVRGWPEDGRWRKEVSSVLSDGVPRLVQLIGLPWPVQGTLNVLEIHTPLLEGYAGFYDPSRDEITISEDLDDLTIIHEASHAWFNESLFTERWITEGLADEYAARVLTASGSEVAGPDRVKATSKVAFPLVTWGAPAPISDTQSDAREQYGYDASWTVVRKIVTSAGEDGMRRVFQAAHDGTTAYVGSGTPERSRLPNDWRRFLDLTEEVGGATGVSDLMATWVIGPDQQGMLATRATARDDYHALIAESGTWAAPVVVRMALDGWSFDAAETGISTARSILQAHDATAAEAASLSLTPPTGLEPAYEGADSLSALEAASQLATTTETSLEAVSAAAGAAAAPRDWLTELGLVGKEPDTWLADARADWQQGSFAAATDAAGLVVGTLAVAGDAGRGRAILIACAVALILLLVALVALIVRHRRRHHARALVAVGVTPSDAYPSVPMARRPGAGSEGRLPDGPVPGTAPLTSGLPESPPVNPELLRPSAPSGVPPAPEPPAPEPPAPEPPAPTDQGSGPP